MTLGRTGSMVADRYRLDQLTASADTFEHWRARDERLGRPVVVRLDRVADAGGAAGPDGAEQSGEPAEDWSPQPGLARIAQLNYPAVAAVFDAGMVVDPVTGPLRYAVSEPVEGRSLAQVMAAGPQPWTRTVDWGRQICGALAALHGIGVAHGSLGPDNVAVRDDRMIKVFDAGLAPDLEAGDDADPDEDGPDGAQSGEPSSTNAETRLIGGGERDAGAAERTSVLPSEWTSASRISVEKSSVEKTIGMTAAMKLNLADYEAKIISKLPPGAPADMYALGSLLWHAVCGEPPAAVEAEPEADRADAGAEADAGDEAGETGGGEDVDLAKTALIADPNAKTTVVRQQDGDDDRDSDDRGNADRHSDDRDAAAGPDPAPLLAAGAPAGFALLLQELLDPDPARRPTSARALPRFAALVAAARASDKATMVVPPVPAQGLSPTQVIRTAPVAGRRAAAADAVVLPSQTPRRTLMLIGLILLLAALGTGIGVLVASVAGNSSQQQNNTPPVTSSTTGPVSSITLPSVTATSASPSPTQDTATTQPAAPPPSPSPSPSPSASASPSATGSTSPTGSSDPSCSLLPPILCPSTSPSPG